MTTEADQPLGCDSSPTGVEQSALTPEPAVMATPEQSQHPDAVATSDADAPAASNHSADDMPTESAVAKTVSSSGNADEHVVVVAEPETQAEPVVESDSAAFKSKDPADLPSATSAADDDTDTDEEAVSLPSRVTRNRATLIRVQSSDSESDKAAAAPRTRTRRQRASTGDSTTNKVMMSPKKTRGRRGRPPASSKTDGTSRSKGRKSKGKPKGKKSKDKDEATDSDDGEPGDYVHVEVGDCVLLDSGDPDNSFIALVSAVQRSQNFVKGPGTFTAQWYYKPADVREEVRALIPGGVLNDEVFLSPHKDKNSIDAVIGLCHVVAPDEYDDVQSEIKRGFREKTKPYYICRYKYYPNRLVKKALEAVKNDAIRSGLGPMKPKIGANYQADVPPFEPRSPLPTNDSSAPLPWTRTTTAAVSSPLPYQGEQIWSPLVREHHGPVLHQFLQLLKPVRFSIGNVLKVYRRQDALAASGHVRCIVLEYAPSDHVRVCLATGTVASVLPSDLSSPLGDDCALAHLYRARFSLCVALEQCTATLAHAQQVERDAFRMEVVEFAQLEARAAGLLTESDNVDDDDDDDDDEESDASASPPQDDDDHDDDDDDDSGVRVRALRKRRK